MRERASHFPGVAAVESNTDLIVVQFIDTSCMDSFVRQMILYGFTMTTDDKFEDFALVHASHELPMPCDWLIIRREDEGTSIWLKPEWVDPSPLLTTVGENAPPAWGTPMGHGFMLAREKDYDVWLDFNSGRTVVCLKEVRRRIYPHP